MNSKSLLLSFSILLSLNAIGQTNADLEKKKAIKSERPIAAVDNNRYWKKMAKRGLATLNPDVIKVLPAEYTGTRLKASGLKDFNSPDVPLFDESSTQSENSITIDPNNNEIVMNSNNSTPNPISGIFGANFTASEDAGITWEGQKEGAGGGNSGDPAVAINRDGRYFVGYISSNSGQGVSYSDDKGETWTNVQVANPGNNYSALLDKNHLWIDNDESSPYEGNLYNAWTPFGAGNVNQIELSRSTDAGETWSDPVVISEAINAGSHCQGVNINSGPNGEAYAVYAVYDAFPAGECAIGFNKSLDGGATWSTAKRIISDIKGVREFTGIGKDMRINGFPCMAVDASDGANSGNIYVTWANVGVPGTNTGNGTNIYVIVSEDQGETWSDPICINQDDPNSSSKQFLPWITCDPETGVVSAIFYDDRNVGGNKLEVFCANSYDGGVSWEDFKVSDVAFTPAPIPGMASGYMGDYLGITSRGGKVYPCWPDNRTGSIMTYVSPYELVLVAAPYDLNAELNQSNGNVELNWSYEEEAGFEHFIVLRDGVEITTTTEKQFSQTLEAYGKYEYRVIALYNDGTKSVATKDAVQWGNPKIALSDEVITKEMNANQVAEMAFKVSNPGELPMEYDIKIQAPASKGSRSYCDAKGGGNDEYIARVQFSNIDNSSNYSDYSDFTSEVAEIEGGQSYELTVTGGASTYPQDYCVAFIDWNNDGDFEDEGETIDFPNSPSSGPYVTQVNVPTSAASTITRLRVRTAYGEKPGPCGTTGYGETEDYSVNVKNWLSLDVREGNLNAGEEQEHKLSFNTNNLSDGLYAVDLKITSNAVENSEIILPVQLTVGSNPFVVSASASPERVCPGGSAQLDVTVEDADNCTFSWTSSPVGFTSTEKNPTVTLEHSTSYSVAVTKGGETSYASVIVSVNKLPIFDLGEDKEVCDNETISIGIDEIEGASYLWSNGETTREIQVAYNNNEADTYSLTVTSEEGCDASDDIVINWKECVSIEEVMVKDGFKIYPNPAKTKIYLAIFKDFSKNATLQVYDMQGRCILVRDEVNAGQKNILDVSQLPKGVYTFILKSNGQYAQEKLIVQ